MNDLGWGGANWKQCKCFAKMDSMYGESLANNGKESGLHIGRSISTCKVGKVIDG